MGHLRNYLVADVEVAADGTLGMSWVWVAELFLVLFLISCH